MQFSVRTHFTVCTNRTDRQNDSPATKRMVATPQFKVCTNRRMDRQHVYTVRTDRVLSLQTVSVCVYWTALFEHTN